MIGQTVGHLWDKVKDKFVQDDDGLWYNVRLDIEKDKRKKFTESRRNNVSGKNQHDKPKVIYNGHMTSHMENRNENVFNNNKEAFDEISKNYQETESHRTILLNWGWNSATDNDCRALLFHFLESQIDLKAQTKDDIKNHFKRWLNKVPKVELQTIAKKINERQ
jgi:hypothetical protein